MNIVVKGIINVFTVIDGKLCLLINNDNFIEYECNDEIDKLSNNYINSIIKCNSLNLKQCYTFSKKDNNSLILTILYVDIINYNEAKIIDGYSFRELDKLDNNIYIEKSMSYLKDNLVLNTNIKKLYPGEFVLPEIQKLYENLLGKKYDRRNFRKKLIKLNIIEDLNKMSNNKNGRPAKLYKFNDIKEERILF